MNWIRAALFGMVMVPMIGHATEGLIATRNHRAAALLTLRFTPGQVALKKGEREWNFDFGLANDLRVLPGSVEDYEVQRLAGRYRQAIRDGEEFWVELPVVNRGGGVLDPLITTWHKVALGWTDPFRDLLPNGGSRISGPGFQYASATGFGDASVGLSKALSPGTTARLALKLPTGNAAQFLGSGGVDLGFALDHFVTPRGRWSAAMGAALIFQGKSKGAFQTRPWSHQLWLGLIYDRNSRDQWILQWQQEGPPLRTGIRRADGPHRLVTLGWRHKASNSDTWEFSLSEDRDLLPQTPQVVNTGPDVTIGVNWRRKL